MLAALEELDVAALEDAAEALGAEEDTAAAAELDTPDTELAPTLVVILEADDVAVANVALPVIAPAPCGPLAV